MSCACEVWLKVVLETKSSSETVLFIYYIDLPCKAWVGLELSFYGSMGDTIGYTIESLRWDVENERFQCFVKSYTIEEEDVGEESFPKASELISEEGVGSGWIFYNQGGSK